MVGIGLLGSGFVSEFYMDGLRDVRDATAVANYSRSAERAAAFGSRYGIPRPVHLDAELCADPASSSS